MTGEERQGGPSSEIAQLIQQLGDEDRKARLEAMPTVARLKDERLATVGALAAHLRE